MLQPREHIGRLDDALFEGEKRIADGVFRIASMNAHGKDTVVARQILASCEAILAECRETRKLLIEALQMQGPSSGS